MERVCLTVDTEELMQLYRSLLPEAKELPLQVTGSSMTPFLAENRDTVYLSAVARPLRVGDIVLYRRQSGAYILHRICKIEQDSFTLIGDAQTVRETGVSRDQIFGLVQWVERKGRALRPGMPLWDFFGKFWVRMIPLRPMLRRAYGLLRKIR